MLQLSHRSLQLTVFQYNYVMWTTPSQPNGIITDYTITYNIGGIVNTVNVPYSGVTISTIKYLVIMLHLHIYGMLF